MALIGWSKHGAAPVRRILRVTRCVDDLAAARAFYCSALGFDAVGDEPPDDAAIGLAAAGRRQAILHLGGAEIALLETGPAHPGPPGDRRSSDLWFQHLAIVVADIDAAFAHLAAHGGWQPISIGGPQTLPPANGGVRAFKFRDPDGHPLELIWFPRGQGRARWHEPAGGRVFLGIDHSALAISSTPRSVGFYRGLGLRVVARSLNRGAPQSRLDALPKALVRVTGLRPSDGSSVGLELLAYRPLGRRDGAWPPRQWTVLQGTGAGGVLRDPDGHVLVVR